MQGNITHTHFPIVTWLDVNLYLILILKSMILITLKNAFLIPRAKIGICYKNLLTAFHPFRPWPKLMISSPWRFVFYPCVHRVNIEKGKYGKNQQTCFSYAPMDYLFQSFSHCAAAYCKPTTLIPSTKLAFFRPILLKEWLLHFNTYCFLIPPKRKRNLEKQKNNMELYLHVMGLQSKIGMVLWEE